MTYFLNHTANCYKKKLYKLLFLLDFYHFADVGRNVTHFDYFAWKMGPVPTALHEAIESEDEELISRFDIHIENLGKDSKGDDIDGTQLENRFPFDAKYFSEKELAQLNEISEAFYNATGKELEDFTHQKGTPWYRVWVEEKRPQQLIPYSYALDRMPEAEREVILDIANERAEI